MIINITASRAEVKELLQLHQRATNTLEPEKWPSWLQHYERVLLKAEGAAPGDVHGAGEGPHALIITLGSA